MNSSLKRILYVEGNVDGTIGGSYFSLLYLVCSLDRQQYHPIVAFAKDTTFRQQFHEHGIETCVIPPTRAYVARSLLGRLIRKPINFFRGWIVEPVRLASVLRRRRVSLVHLNNSIIKNHFWMLASLIARVPCVTHERGINAKFLLRVRLLARSLKAIICISSAVHDNMVASGLGHLRLTTIHNGLDPNSVAVNRSVADIAREFGLDSNAAIVGMIGNIKSWKGQEVLVRAMSLIVNEFPDVCCLLVGDTSPEDEGYRYALLQLIEKLDLNATVKLTGHRPDVANYINAFTIQVHASILPEPFGRVLLEAMALSKPLIASNDGAVPEIVMHGQTGLLFRPGDHKDLAECLRQLLSDPAHALTLGIAGRIRLLDQFSISRHVQQVEQIYVDILSSH